MQEEPIQQPTSSSQPENQQPSRPPEAPSLVPPTPTNYPPQESKKTKKTLVIVSAVVAVLLIVASVIFFIFAFPRLQAESTAASFMSAIENNDNEKMTELSGEGGDSITARIQDGLSGATYKKQATDQKESGFNVHFDISGSSSLSSVTIVVEKNKVTNVIIKSKTSKEADSSPTPSSSTNPAPTTAPTSCLAVADLNSVGYTGYDQITSKQTLESYYFQADSTNYESGYYNDTRAPAQLYAKFSNKAFNFSLRGAVNQATATSGGIELAQERATKVRDDLIAAGVPASRISLEDPTTGSVDTTQTAYRTVALFIYTPSDCTINGE